MEYEVGDVVFCTVTKIVGTTVFVKMYGDKENEGSIITSEIAPGRIRNLRDYVVPNKKIVCKIIRISNRHIDLSLRRVSEKEKKEVLDKIEKQRNAESILKIVLKQTPNIIDKIKKEFSPYEFIRKLKQDAKLAERFLNKEQSEKLLKIINEKKEKQISVKKNFSLKCKAPNGITKIKTVLENTEAKYLGSSKFQLNIQAENFKQANTKTKEIIEKLEKKAKQNHCEFLIKEK